MALKHALHVLAVLVLFSCYTSASVCPEFCVCTLGEWECTNLTTLANFTSAFVDSVAQPPEKVVLIHVVPYDTSAIKLQSDDYQSAFYQSVYEVEFRETRISRSLYLQAVSMFTNVTVWTSVNNSFVCDIKLKNTVQFWNFPLDNKTTSFNCTTKGGKQKEFFSLSNRNSKKNVMHRAVGNFECPQPCECNVDNSTRPSGDLLVPNVLIDCSHSNLTYVPYFSLNKFEKESWIIEVDLSHNQIEDVSLMIDIPAYSNVRVLNLAFNLIQSVESFMGFEPSSDPCLIHFRMLNLAFNKLTKLPHGFLDHTNYCYQSLVMLRSNPFWCDCDLVTYIQVAVQKQMLVVSDYHHTACFTNSEGTEGWYMDSENLVDLFCKEQPPFDKWAAISIGINTTASIIFIALVTKLVIHLRYLYNRGTFNSVAFFLSRPVDDLAVRVDFGESDDQQQ